MSNSPNSFKTANTGLENDSLNRKLVAICGIGVCDAKNTRGAQGLWKKIVEGELIARDEKKINREGAEFVRDETITHGSERKSNGPVRRGGIEKILSEVAYEALQDGAVMNYRGHEPLVGCFVTAFEKSPPRDNTSSIFTKPKEESTPASKLIQRYDLRGPRYDHRSILQYFSRATPRS
jgi:hypothetical protein